MPVITGDRRRDAEIRDELAQHCADRYRELVAAGDAEDAAIRRVRAEVKATARARAGLADSAASDPAARTGRRLARAAESLASDVRVAWRRLRRSPVFLASSVLTLAVAIGATTGMASLIRAVLLQPLPNPDSDRLVLIWEVSPQGNARNVVSGGNYTDWQARQHSFAAIGAMQAPSFASLTGNGDPRRVTRAFYSAQAMTVLAPALAAGRRFNDRDGEPGAPLVALVSHRFWRTAFAADPAVVGRSATLDGQRYEIVGVLPERTAVPDPSVDFVTPLRLSPASAAERVSHNYLVIGRLRDGVTIEAASAEMKTIAAGLAAEHPANMTGWSANVVSLHEDLVGGVRPYLLVLGAIVFVVLGLAGANLANLQLARAASRAGEIGLQAALGASRSRLAGSIIAESLVVAAAGAAIGVGLVAIGRSSLVTVLPDDIPRLDEVAIDPQVLLLALFMTVGTVLVTGLAPAWQASRAGLAGLTSGGRVRSDPRQRRLRVALVGVQVGLAALLLVAAGLLARSIWRLDAVDPGFDPEQLLTVQLDLPRARYPDNAAHRRFYDDLLAQVRALPGVVAAAGSTVTPGTGTGMTFSYGIEGRPSPTPTGREAPVPLQAVTTGYFEAMGIDVVAGRTFGAGDHEGSAPVIMVNEALARLHWGEQRPVGQRLSFRPGQQPWMEIVGVVADTRDAGRAAPAPPTLYVAFAQKPSTWAWMTWQTLVVRASRDVGGVVAPIRAAVRRLDPDLPLLEVQTMHDALGQSERRRRFALRLFSAFAGIAVLLGGIGVYGVLAFGVAERRQELGIRLMLGARPRQIVGPVVRSTMIVAGLGLAAGLAGAFGVTRWLSSLLFEVAPTDPLTYLLTGGMLAVVAALAAWIPARRALRVDPVEAMR
jgi:predicted permease